MTARRQSSTTSLSRFARADDGDDNQRSLDFCNAFWGKQDVGVDVLFARMRGASRTIEELKAFWKERAAIEEDYAKRLTALSKKPLGRDEIGELRNSLDTIRLETANQGATHQELMSTVRRVLEAQASEFATRQTAHRRTFQAHIEKQYKAKQTQESYVEKAREKYEQDCIRINSYTAQSTLVQGRDYDKLQLKLDRVRQSVQANERDYANFSQALADTCAKWEKDWRAFCDQCQDLEEERIEFTKNNMWTFANAVSTACVADDESCEKLRISLELVDAPVEQENFVRVYGTGNDIPNPPRFVDYKKVDPSQVPQDECHKANFARSSALPPPAMRQPEEDEQSTVMNQAGIGAGGGGQAPAPTERARSRANSRARNSVPEAAPASSDFVRGGPPPSAFVAPPMPAQQQQQHQAPSPAAAPRLPPIAPSAPLSTHPSSVGDAADPLAMTLENLRAESAASASTVGRRSSVNIAAPPQQQYQQYQQQHQQQQQPQQQQLQQPRSPSRASRRTSVASGSRNSGLDIDYRTVAEAIVGAHPSSRPSSPSGAPTAKFMQPPALRASPVPVEEVMGNYSQAFPGEHTHRRALSRQNSMSRQSVAGAGSDMDARGRPVSREGHAGIGANGRAGSISPAPPAVRMGVGQHPQQSQRAPSPMRQPSHASQQQQRAPSPMRMPPQQQQQRAASPMHPQHSGSSRPLGIAFDADGRVTQDAMAERFTASPYHQQNGSYPSGAGPYAQASGYAAPANGYAPAVSPAPTGFSSAGSGTTSFSQQPQPGSAGFGQQQQQQQQQYRGPPTQPPPMGFPPPTPTPAQYYQQQYQQQQAAQQAQQQPPQHQPRQSSGYAATPAPAPAPAQQNGWQSPHQQQASAYQQAPAAVPNGYPAPPTQAPRESLSGPPQQQPQRAPSPQPQAQGQAQPAVPPTGQYLDDGKGVLFYVKALYDYHATIDEEFDFQSGDVIAVTATPEDGWWSGWLLDDTRRVPGRHVFPSNFVCLF